jgi:hypothetical protein
MAVYRFRVTFEDNEEVYREIEIKSTQNFEDFHNIIVSSINFDNQHNASFYISDDYWRKGDEITLRPIDEDDAELRKRKGLAPKKQMNKCKIVTVIDDPHQKFVYIYDLKTGWTFLVELVKILEDDSKISYPRCVKTSGEAPKQYKTNAIVPPVDEDDEDGLDEPHSDDEAYVNAHSEDETALLEGEEGEVEEEDEQQEEEHSEEEGSEFGAEEQGDDF